MMKTLRHKDIQKYMHGAFMPLLVGFNVLIMAVTLFAAFGGNIDPEKMPFASLANMTFPLWYFLSVVLLIVDLFIARMLAVVPAVALLGAIQPLLVFTPINFTHPKLEPADSLAMFKVLSYNTLSFTDEADGKERNPEYNRTMHTILESDADVLVLLEFENQGKLNKFVPTEQIDSFRAFYPYYVRGAFGTVIFSREPIERVRMREDKPRPNAGSMMGVRTSVHQRPLTVFGVHLESVGLDDDDKALYREITDRSTESVDVDSVKNRLVDKLYLAFKNRASQARYLSACVDSIGGDVIVCGDFNDVPNCYAIRQLEKLGGMQDAYAKVGCGPTITYHDSRFFFRIDHVLWRGNFRPVSMVRGKIPSSDHYPFLTTFVWNR
jgi:endonuclease/exonuclease/phosphatase (EEP) superfamily protein YafD